MKQSIILLTAVVLLTACKTTERVVTVPEIHDYHHWHTDSVKHTDSVFIDRQTTIMQLDSAAMAAYGIRLKDAERAWLVKTQELEKVLSQISQTKADTIHERDSIPVPYPVEVIREVEKNLSWWQKTRMHGGDALMALLGIGSIYRLWRVRRKIGIFFRG